MGAGIEIQRRRRDKIAATNGESVTYVYATTRSRQDRRRRQERDHRGGILQDRVRGDVADLEDVGAGGISDLWAWLAPAGKTGDDDDRARILSYVTCRPVTDPKSDEGDIINFGECVTYLMFPYLTCGDSANWTTAIAIANTTMDDGVFGISGGAAAQSGNIMLHAFPRSVMGEDGMMMMHDPMSMELTESLAAGDTYSTTCSKSCPGLQAMPSPGQASVMPMEWPLSWAVSMAAQPSIWPTAIWLW